MDLCNNKLYLEDVKNVASVLLPWDKLRNKSLLISGATGLIGSFLVDVIMYKNTKGLHCTIYTLGRNLKSLERRFSYYSNNKYFIALQHDINTPLIKHDIPTVDYILHLASNTHPLAYATEPISTITTNIIGTINMLEFAYPQ